NEFKNIIIISIVIGLIGALMGLLISYQVNIPSGASIIFSLVIFFILAKIVQVIKHKIFIKINA
ncbi:MAG: metal ABC transporter permease, partial [Bacteroidales bacterium]